MTPPESTREPSLLYVIGSLDLGGAERHVAQIAPLLKDLGWRPAIYCLGRCGRQAQSVQASGIEVIAPPMELSLASGNRPLKAVGITLSAIKLAAVMAARRPTIVHFFLPAAYLIGAPAALLTRVPVCVMSRRSLNVYQDIHPIARYLEPRLHNHMSAILANSERVRQQLIDEEGCAPDHVDLIYNGVDTKQFHVPSDRSALRERLGVAPDTFVITVLANLIAYKGHADLLAGLATVQAELPRPWLLQCIGRDDGLKCELSQLAENLGLGENVRFLGEQADVASYLTASDMSVLPSHQEGFANAILEAMACGLPVVATDVGGNAEAVKDGETGRIVDAHDAEALGRAIAEIAQNPEAAQAMGRAGRKRAEDAFSITSCAKAYDAFYRTLIPPQ